MMRNLYIDPVTYDLALQNSNLRLTVNTTEWLSAKLEAKLKTFYREWFANQSIGVPYYEEILKKQVDINNVQVILSNIIKGTTGVQELVSFEIDFDSSIREYTYTFTVIASSGETVTSGGTL